MADAQKVSSWFKKWTSVINDTKSFVVALVALAAALTALTTAVRHVNQATRTQDQTKIAMGILAAGQDQLAHQAEQNRGDLIALHEYVTVRDKDDDGIIEESDAKDAADAGAPIASVRMMPSKPMQPIIIVGQPTHHPPLPVISPPLDPIKRLKIDDVYRE